MTTADRFDADTGDPVFHTTFQAFAEGLDGNGILDAGDLAVTAGTNTNALDVAATTRGLWYGGTLHSYAGATNVLSLSSNTSGSPRWDLVYFDTGTSSPGKREGTPATKPDLPELQSGEFPLAAVYLPDGTTDVTDSDIRDYRVHGTAAEETWFEDSPGEFSSSTVEGALTEVIREAGDPLNGPLDLSGFSGSAVLDLGTNPGTFGAVVDAVVDGNDAAGTEESFLFAVDSTTVLKIYAESDGSGGVQNLRAEVPQGLRTADDVTDDRGNTLYSYSSNEFTQARLGGPASSLTSYPLPIGDLDSPYALPSITDMDVDSTDLTDSTGPGTLYDASAGEFLRGVLDQNRNTSSVSSNTTTSDEEILFVDTSGGAVTITLASADAVDGNHIIVVDSGGSADSNPLTIDTEGSETIDGVSSVTVETAYGAQVLSSDGTNWFTAGGGSGGGYDQTVDFDHSGSKTSLSTGNQALVGVAEVDASETLEIYKAQLMKPDGTASSTSVDLELVTLDNAGSFTSRSVLIAGDGSTVYDDQTGSPLGSYSPGSTTTVAVLVDNQSGSAEGVYAEAKGEVV
jgi:hypothetical protein